MAYLHVNIIGCAEADSPHVRGLDLPEIDSALLPYCALRCLRLSSFLYSQLQQSQHVVDWPIDLNEFLIHRMLT